MAGATTAAGYGNAHQKLRRQLARAVARGEAYCARCGDWIAPPGQPCTKCGKPTYPSGNAVHGHCGWDVGHDDFDRTKYSGPEHACCNRATNRRGRRIVTAIQRATWW
jgi:hypothetical protein